MFSSGIDVAGLGSAGAVVLVVYFFLRYMREDAIKRDEVYTKVAGALDALNEATSKNTEATHSADTYLRGRNGRDNEHHAATLKAIEEVPATLQKIADDQAAAVIEAVKVERAITEQHVQHQTVERETVGTHIVDRRKESDRRTDQTSDT